jgi:hypothetical protein
VSLGHPGIIVQRAIETVDLELAADVVQRNLVDPVVLRLAAEPGLQLR